MNTNHTPQRMTDVDLNRHTQGIIDAVQKGASLAALERLIFDALRITENYTWEQAIRGDEKTIRGVIAAKLEAAGFRSTDNGSRMEALVQAAHAVRKGREDQL